MKVRLLNQLGLTRRLRQFLVLFTLLLMPLGVWADYELYVQYGTEESNFHSVLVPENTTDVLGDGTITYDVDTHVLTLNGANLTCSYDDNAFIFNNGYWDAELQLTVRLLGSNTITLGNGSSFYNGKGITFTTDENNTGSLTIIKESGWNGILFTNGGTAITPTYNNHLYLDHDVESECLIQWLVCPGPFSYNDGNNIVFRFGNETGNDDEEIHYSIDYVDENLQDVTDAVYDVSGNDQPLLGPCTMTYYITAGGGQSETKTAKLFGLATNSVTTTLGTPVAPPTIVPAFDHSEDLIITETQTPATGVAPVYNGTTGLISTSAVGETTCSVKLSNSVANGYDYLVLNDNDDNQKHVFGNFTLTVNELVNFPISVAGVQVTNANAGDVMGDGTDSSNPTVVYDGNTLYLEDAVINGDIVYTDNENPLWIDICGTNTVNRITYTGQQENYLYVNRAGDNTATHSLTVAGNETDAAISGFANMPLETDFYDIELGLYWKPTFTGDVMTSLLITTNIFGGEGTVDSPYIISTPTQLETFATLYNASELVSDCYVELGDDINCAGLQGFEPIGTPEMPFIGHFDGASHKISNLLYEAGSEDDYAGLFRKVGDDDDDEPAPGYVLNLTLENCTFGNGNMDNGAIAGILNKGTIDNCTVTSCSILSEASQPSCGGIVGSLYGGSITNCTVSGSTITATSVAGGLAGGIVAFAYGSDNGSATVSGCQVTGTATNPTTITSSSNYGDDQGDNPTGGIVGHCGDEYSIVISNNKVSGNTTISSIDYYDDDNYFTCAGAIVGDKGNASFSNNYYYYTVTTSTKNGEAAAVTRNGYMQRGTGFAPYNYQLQQETEDYDILTDNGAMLYTKKLTIDMEHVVEGGPDGWYEPLSNYQNGIFYLVPGQETNVMLQSDDNYSITSVSLSYTTTEGGDPTVVNLENVGEGSTFESSFVMPDYEATLNVAYTAKPSIWIGDVEVREDGTFPDYGETALFDADNKILTLYGINYSGEITSGLDELTIKVTGTNNQIGKIVSLNPEATLTFAKASAADAASLSLSTAQMAVATTVISGFASVDFGDMYLSSSTPYQYDTTNKLLVNAIAEETEELTSATITSETAYPLWIGSIQVTGSSVVSDKITRNGVYEGEDYGVTFTAG
ncbi:MAG: hypothetical protein J5610_05690, partial [Prevotella sp.]|nr:hypothetical protein [Prevotella sp.]